MGKTSRKKYTPEVKAQVVIEALKEQSTLAELAATCPQADGAYGHQGHLSDVFVLPFAINPCKLKIKL